jgi:hypothetical protein
MLTVINPPPVSPYKDFKHHFFFLIRNNNSCIEIIFDNSGWHKFPLYWEREPAYLKGFDYDKLIESERHAAKFLETFVPVSCKDLIDNEFDADGLQNLLHNFFFFCRCFDNVCFKLVHLHVVM